MPAPRMLQNEKCRHSILFTQGCIRSLDPTKPIYSTQFLCPTTKLDFESVQLCISILHLGGENAYRSEQNCFSDDREIIAGEKLFSQEHNTSFTMDWQQFPQVNHVTELSWCHGNSINTVAIWEVMQKTIWTWRACFGARSTKLTTNCEPLIITYWLLGVSHLND